MTHQAQGLQPNMNFSSLPSQYLPGGAAAALTPGGGVVAGPGIIRNNNNNTAMLLPSGSVQAQAQHLIGANTKQLSMAEINDLLS